MERRPGRYHADRAGTHSLAKWRHFTQTGDITQPDGTTMRFMTVHGRRVQDLKTIGTE